MNIECNTVDRYEQHRLMAHTGQAWVYQNGAIITADARDFQVGQVIAGRMLACVSKKNKGRHIYLHTSKKHERIEWLKRKAAQHGFEVLSAHCQTGMETIHKPSGGFTVDATEFVFVIKVTDTQLFQAARVSGISSTSKTYGFNFINI